MSEEQSGGPPGTAAEQEERPLGMISAVSALRLILALLTIWTLVSGLSLIFFQEGADATIGGGLEGDQGAAAQRLLGVHLLVLTPIYGLIVWKPRQYWPFLWVPYAAQIGVVIVTFFDIVSGDREFKNGALPLIVAAVFASLLLYVWWAGRKPDEEEEEDVVFGADPPAAGPDGSA
jgi:hypothetical protein